MKINSKILICYNSPVSIFSIYNGKPARGNIDAKDLSESGFSKEIEKIKESLEEYFIEVKTFTVNRNIERTIKEINNYSPDIIFNFVESVEGIAAYEFCMAGLFELLGHHFTGNPPSALGNCLNKERTKSILGSFNINTPKSITAKPSAKISNANFNLNYPVILKLLNEDASIGISEFSVVNDLKSLKKQLRFLFDTYQQEVLIEEYIDGREINAAVLGGKVLHLSEIEFNGLPEGLPKIVTYDGKWVSGSIYYENTKPKCPAEIDSKIKKKIEEIALLSFEVMGCRDYARVDIRLDRKGEPYVIEVNPNPDISTDSGFARAASTAGFSYSNLLFTIANFALIRKENDSQIKAS